MIYGTEKLRELVERIPEMRLLRKSIRGASIDLRINDIAHVRTDTEPLILADCVDKNDMLQGRLKEIDLAKGYQLRPNCYLYGNTFEKIVIPDNMCGIIVPRSTFARIGLNLPISMYANPGYHGYLPLIIHNFSPVPVEIPPYYRVAQLLFCELNGKADPYGKQDDAKYHDELQKAYASIQDKESLIKKVFSEEELKKYLDE